MGMRIRRGIELPKDDFINMTIGILGAGYVGLATAAGFAARGFEVICGDVNEEKIAILKEGKLPFFEKGMLEVFAAASIPVVFSLDVALACRCDVVFCCVGTPSAPDGSADLSFVRSVALTCAEIAPNAVFVLKSTVPPGTSRAIAALVEGKLRVAANPEFLREGCAVEDALKPSRVVIGADDPSPFATSFAKATEVKKASEGLPSVLSILLDLYSGTGAPIVSTNTITAEMVKYASNSFLATKISFINDMANLCDVVGADVLAVAEGMGLDDRIGAKFLQPGPGYGGSCFPKDVKALMHLGASVGVPLRILEATTAINDERQMLPYRHLRERLGDIRGKRIAIWGLAFKPGTDDVRDAPALRIIEQCLADGAMVIVYDPLVRQESMKQFPMVEFADSAHSALVDTHALVVMTDWPEFSDHRLYDIEARVSSGVVIDLRFVLR